jgi:hypothetical protein
MKRNWYILSQAVHLSNSTTKNVHWKYCLPNLSHPDYVNTMLCIPVLQTARLCL